MRNGPSPAHVPALDGLRGLAVAAVVLFHTGHLCGGFLGVDLFFTLSGFLITSLLISEAASNGDIDLAHFWGRRARRLLPALFALLLTVAVAARLFGQAFEMDALRAQALASLLYVANWNQILAGTDYWARQNAPSLLQHTWSLAIEEQFYMVWPLVFASEWRGAVAKGVAASPVQAGLRRLQFVSVVFAGLSLAVMLTAGWLGSGENRLYFGSDTRFASILIGCALACRSRLGAPVAGGATRILLEVAAALALVAIVGSWFVFEGQSAFVYRGGLLVLAVAASVVMLAVVHPRPGPVAKLLAAGPLRGLGTISYGLYLWHWPLLQLLSAARTGLAGAPLLVLQLGASLAVALLSYVVLERPVRSGRLVTAKQARVVVPGMFALVAAVVMVAIRAPDVDVSMALRRIPFDAGRYVDDVGRARRPRVLLVGDSVGDSLAGALYGRGDRTGVDVTNRARIGCGVQREVVRIRFPDGTVAPDGEGCAAAIDAWTADIGGARPDVVALVLGYAGGLDKEVEGQWATPCDPHFLGWYRAQLLLALRTLTMSGVPLAITTAPYKGDGAHPSLPRDRDTECLNDLYRGLRADFPSLAVVDLGEEVCPGGVCRVSVEGQAMRPDGLHFRGVSAVVTGSWLVESLLALPR